MYCKEYLFFTFVLLNPEEGSKDNTVNTGDRIQYIRQHWVSHPHAHYGSATQMFFASRQEAFCDLCSQLYSAEAILLRLNCTQVYTSVRSYKRFYPKTVA